MKHRLAEYLMPSTEAIQDVQIAKVWNAITLAKVFKITNSFRRRYELVIERRGGHTSY